MIRVIAYTLIGLGILVILTSFNRGETAVAERKEAKSDSLFADMLNTEHQAAHGLHALAEEYLRIASERDSLRDLSDDAAARRPVILTRIERVAGDSIEVLRAVAELEANHAQETNALRAQLLGADVMLANRDSALALKDSLNASLRLALYAARGEAREWERVAKPSFLGVELTPTRMFVAGLAAGCAVEIALTGQFCIRLPL